MKEYGIDNENIVNRISEPLSKWGGQWTEEKLDTFAKYVNAYLTIMNNYRNRFNWKLIYFDGFAGSGSRYEEINSTSELLLDLFDDDAINCDEINLYQGAAERILSIEQEGFDYYYFIDKDQSSINKLKDKLTANYVKNGKLEFRCCDANEEVIRMSKVLKAKLYKKQIFLHPVNKKVKTATIFVVKTRSQGFPILICPTGLVSQ